MGYSPWRHKRVRHNLTTEQQTKRQTRNFSTKWRYQDGKKHFWVGVMLAGFLHTGDELSASYIY